MKTLPHSAIVIPAYNEGAVIGAILKDLTSVVKKTSGLGRITIIVVNDGSDDNTAEIVAKHKGVTLINHLLNSGAGAATRTGMTAAKKLGADIVVTMDSDGQHSPSDALKILKLSKKSSADLIVGSRLIDPTGMPWYRVLGNKGLSLITYLIFGVLVKDSQSGLRAYNKKALNLITFHSNHYAFCSEIIWSAHRQKLTITEVPIKAIYSDYSLSKGQSNWGAFAIIKQITKRRLLSIIYG